MTKLEPLQQWICDTCGELIAKVDDGWLEWVQRLPCVRHSFRIVHHFPASPRATLSRHRESKFDEGCYMPPPGNGEVMAGNHLNRFTALTGNIHMLSLLDAGALHIPEYDEQVSDVRSWNDTFRRLFIPYYEEARQYFERAANDDFLAGANEVLAYTPEFLQAMCVHYGKTMG